MDLFFALVSVGAVVLDFWLLARVDA